MSEPATHHPCRCVTGVRSVSGRAPTPAQIVLPHSRAKPHSGDGIATPPPGGTHNCTAQGPRRTGGRASRRLRTEKKNIHCTLKANALACRDACALRRPHKRATGTEATNMCRTTPPPLARRGKRVAAATTQTSRPSRPRWQASRSALSRAAGASAFGHAAWRASRGEPEAAWAGELPTLCVRSPDVVFRFAGCSLACVRACAADRVLLVARWALQPAQPGREQGKPHLAALIRRQVAPLGLPGRPTTELALKGTAHRRRL